MPPLPKKPHSKQPRKECQPYKAPTLVDETRDQLKTLFKNFEKPIALPERGDDSKLEITPRNRFGLQDIETGGGPRFQSSSTEFHIYRAARRKEYHRQQNLELEAQKVSFFSSLS